MLDEPHLMLAVRYIARNRTKATLAADPASDEWSSYPGVVGIAHCWPFIDRSELLSHFGAGGRAVANLRDFVEGEERGGRSRRGVRPR